MPKKAIKKIWRLIRAIIAGLFWYFDDLLIYRRMLKNAGAERMPIKFFPQIFDRNPDSHSFDRHYVYMDRWVFKQLLDNRPAEHIDVGSSIRFLSMASAITRLKFIDIRPIKPDFDNFQCIAASILSLPFADNSVSSLSCLHVAEHIGLGRYGDRLDALGTQKACRELARVLAPGGNLYFALPIGKPAVYFNAHRVHSPKVIVDYFKDLKLASFAAVDDHGGFLPVANPEDFETAIYACGCFNFFKALPH